MTSDAERAYDRQVILTKSLLFDLQRMHAEAIVRLKRLGTVEGPDGLLWWSVSAMVDVLDQQIQELENTVFIVNNAHKVTFDYD